MERAEFDRVLKDFEMFFTPLSNWQRDEYWDSLRSYPHHLFVSAYKRLRDNYSYKRTPLPGDIKDEIKMILNEGTAGLINFDKLEGCDDCDGTGIRAKYEKVKGFKHKYFTARPCTCPKGQQYEKAWREYRKRKKR